MAERGHQLKKSTSRRGPSFALNCAPPDFLSRFVALINIMRFFLRKTAYVVVASSVK
jgi:hypothetical protein